MNEMQQYLVDEMIEEYQDGQMTRRELLRRVSLITGSLAVATTLVGSLGSAPAAASPARRTQAQSGVTVSPDDPAIEAGLVEFRGDGVTVFGYLARPRGDGPWPAILQVPANRGITEHHADVSRRLAKAGFVSLAADTLSRRGGSATFQDDGAAVGAYGQIPSEQMLSDLVASLAYLRGRPDVRADRLAVTGFCAGGTLTWLLATQDPQLRAAVPFYGTNPPLNAVPNIGAAVLGFYGEEDPRVTSGVPEIEAVMRAAGKTFEFVIYPGARHAFFDDTRDSYNAAAAADAWPRAVDWFGRYLGG